MSVSSPLGQSSRRVLPQSGWPRLGGPCEIHASAVRGATQPRGQAFIILISALVCLVARHVIGKRRVLHAAALFSICILGGRGFSVPLYSARENYSSSLHEVFLCLAVAPSRPCAPCMKTHLVHSLSSVRKHAIPLRQGQGGIVSRGFG